MRRRLIEGCIAVWERPEDADALEVFRVIAGTAFAAAATVLIERAQERNDAVGMIFNKTLVVARPGDTREDVAAVYNGIRELAGADAPFEQFYQEALQVLEKEERERREKEERERQEMPFGLF